MKITINRKAVATTGEALALRKPDVRFNPKFAEGAAVLTALLTLSYFVSEYVAPVVEAFGRR